MAEENILVFCAHSDDQIFGPGATLAKYAKEGKKIYTYVFSYGETSHPHFQRKVIIKIRVEEAMRADDEIKGSGVHFFGLSEGKFGADAKKKNIKKKIGEIILDKKPLKIFTHSSDDPHVDHREVNRIVMDALDEINSAADVFAFDIWNPLALKYRKNPQLIVDVSKTFKTKIRALRHFKSQRLAMIFLMWSIYARAIKNGLLHGYTFAEVFYKIR